jgi:hypothetical protein
MGYIINRYNGAILTTVEDGTVNNTTEVKFVGRNFAGYGETQNENFLHLMENFANPTPPGKPLSGMIWYDSTANKIKFYDGIRWRATGSAEVSALQPIGSVEGDLWWNSTTNQLYTRSAAGEWVLIGPQTTALGTTQFVSRTVKGTDQLDYSIIEAVLSDNQGNESTPLIIAESNFTITPGEIDDQEFISSIIRKGITLADTNADGVSTNSIVWGTASNALRLGGFLASDFIKSDNLNFVDPLLVNNVLKLSADQVDGIIQNIADQSLKFIVRDTNADETILTINLIGLIPGINSTGSTIGFDIGTSNFKWKEVHANSFKGTADKADQLLVGSVHRIASVSAVPNTVAARDASGNLNAVLFQGTATTARYADLAEKYTTEQEWPVGTAMAVCNHEDHEAGPANSSSVAIGVISANPAYLMNSESEGQAIALKGRVPVRVTGPVRKGQAVYAWNDGVCSAVATNALIGVALESNSSEEEKLVECVLKV